MATTIYQLRVISPVHIGTGQEFGGLDGTYHQGVWYQIDIDAVLALSGADPVDLANAMMARDFNWASWLAKRQIAPEKVSARQVACAHNPGNTKVRGCLRDPYGRPSIPGSSLKGAIRTALLESLIENLDKSQRQQMAQQAVQRDERGHPHHDRRYVVGQNTVENQLLIGRNAKGNRSNYDLLRAIHVSDSPSLAPETVQIELVWVYTLRGNQLVPKREGNTEYKLFVESLLPNTETEVVIRLDTELLEGRALKELGFSEQSGHALKEFPTLCNNRAQSLIESEGHFCKDYGLPEMAHFYVELYNKLEEVEAEGGFLLNIGWGGGWETKTVTNPLTDGLDREYEQIRRTFNLGKRDSQEFPKTRRIVFRNNQPWMPLGWVSLTPKR